MVGATAAISCSNSARVTTVLQFAVLDLSAAGLSHTPGIVITAVDGATAAPPAVLPAAGDAVAALCGAGWAAGVAACPDASVVKNNRQIHSR